jgi:RNase P/RNase MRP subunit POP5
MIDAEKERQIRELVTAIDNAIEPFFGEISSTNIAAVLLSRVTHLTAHDPKTGKGLVRHVWEQLDDIEQGDDIL